MTQPIDKVLRRCPTVARLLDGATVEDASAARAELLALVRAVRIRDLRRIRRALPDSAGTLLALPAQNAAGWIRAAFGAHAGAFPIVVHCDLAAQRNQLATIATNNGLESTALPDTRLSTFLATDSGAEFVGVTVTTMKLLAVLGEFLGTRPGRVMEFIVGSERVRKAVTRELEDLGVDVG